jgi:hypothetical protein
VCTFGATNHEVKKTTDGQLETIRPVQGRFYRFNLCQSGGHNPNVLVITEIDATQTAFGTLELQLLDPGDTDACPGWGEELPARLREMHSHWYDRCVTDLEALLAFMLDALLSAWLQVVAKRPRSFLSEASTSSIASAARGSRNDRVCCAAHLSDALLSLFLTSSCAVTTSDIGPPLLTDCPCLSSMQAAWHHRVQAKDLP